MRVTRWTGYLAGVVVGAFIAGAPGFLLGFVLAAAIGDLTYDTSRRCPAPARVQTDPVAREREEADQIFAHHEQVMLGMMATLPGKNVLTRHEEIRPDGTHVSTTTITNALIGGVATVTKEWKP